MKSMLRYLCLLGMAVAIAGCNSHYSTGAAWQGAGFDAVADVQDEVPDRMLIWRASVDLEVSSVSNAVVAVSDVATALGGYIENQSDRGEESASLTLRVPVDTLTTSMEALDAIGEVTRKSVSSKDVTEQYVDTDARLKTKIALRDRLRNLLDKAEDVEDILAIEKELGRVQGDIDSMQARLKTLKGQVDFATIEVSIRRKKILGPVGYVWDKACWLVEKLFVIQE